MTRRVALPIVLLLGSVTSPAAARAGVLSGYLGGYGEEAVSYEARRGASTVITARSLRDGRLVLTDRANAITLATPDSPLSCHLDGRHKAVCRSRLPYPVQSVTLSAGAHGDVVDARSLRADHVSLEGGAGNDILLAPQRVPNSWSVVELSGGRGRNVLLGGPNSVVSYVEARGPVTVDLARRFGAAAGERDRILGVESVRGSMRSHNFLSGAVFGGQIWGGAAGNRIIAHSGRTEVTMPEPDVRRLASVIACVGPAVVVSLLPADVVTDHCRVEAVKLQEPMRSATAPAMTVQAPYGGERRVVLTAGPTVVSEARAQAPPKVVPVRLNGPGRRLLARRGRLRVLVSELSLFPGQSPRLQSRFTTVLEIGAGGR